MGLTKPKPHSNRRRRGSLSPPRFASACLAASAFYGIREAFFCFSPSPPPRVFDAGCRKPRRISGRPRRPFDRPGVGCEQRPQPPPWRCASFQARRSSESEPGKGSGLNRLRPGKRQGWGQKGKGKMLKEKGQGRREWPAQGRGKSGEGRPPNPIGPAAGLAQSAKAFKMKADKTPFSPIGANSGAAKRPAPAVGGRQSQ